MLSLNLPDSEHSYAYIREKQQADQQLLTLPVKFPQPQQYIYKQLDDDVDDILCYYLRQGW